MAREETRKEFDNFRQKEALYFSASFYVENLYEVWMKNDDRPKMKSKLIKGKTERN